MQHVIRILSSYVTTLVTMLIYAAGLAIATLIEKYMGTVAAKLLVYYSPLFFLLLPGPDILNYPGKGFRKLLRIHRF